jgi:hypothetical protein
MKKIERIREDYDMIVEKDDSDTRKLTSLVRAGLFDQNKLPMLKRALQKDPSKLTMAERKGLLELLDSLMSQVLHSQSVYSKVKQNVGSEVNEAIKDHYGVDSRFGNSAAVSERDMPTIIILKRKSIRVYPDNQKVGLYYSQYLDRYVAIPFGASKKAAPFTAINEAVDYEKAYSHYKRDNPEDDSDIDKPSTSTKPKKIAAHAAARSERLKKFVTKKAAEGKIRSIHYSGNDPEKKTLRKIANKSFNDSALKGDINPLDWAASHAGVAAHNAIKKGFHKLKGALSSKKTTSAPPANVSPPNTLSTSGKATANFGTQSNATAQPKITVNAAPAAPPASTSTSKTKPTKVDLSKSPKTAEWMGLKESFRQKITERRRLEEEKRQYGAADAAADAASFIPGPAGSAASLASAGLSASRGDYVGAALDTVGAIPLVGYAAKAAKVARVAKTASEVGKVGKAVDTASDVAKVADKAADVAKIAKPASVASKVGGTLAKGAGKTLKLGGKILKGAALIGAGLAAGAGSSSANDDKKDLTPAKFDMKVKTNTPTDTGTKSGVDTRTSNLYRKSFEGSMKEETAKDDEDKTKTSTTRRFLRPAAASNSKVKISAPKPAGVTTGVDARMRKYERDFYGQQNESVMLQIMTMVKEDVTEMQLNIGENTLKINNTIAKKVVGVYESLNKQNKKKMENMLNEGTTESFMKLINFAIRQ